MTKPTYTTEAQRKTNYLLRNVPPPLWSEAKHLAVDSGMTLRELIIRALGKYVAWKRKQ